MTFWYMLPTIRTSAGAKCSLFAGDLSQLRKYSLSFGQGTMTILSILPFSASFSFLRRRVHASRPSNDYNIYASGVIEAGECPESSTNRERATVTDPGAEWCGAIFSCCLVVGCFSRRNAGTRHRPHDMGLQGEKMQKDDVPLGAIGIGAMCGHRLGSCGDQKRH
ncbi:hypothetical protein FPV67DRAFT_1500341 [Lyophyllum atratum]|nr:hypothetical protein FPV67DRAFT_1500341 [Lyophyllum atratum]